MSESKSDNNNAEAAAAATAADAAIQRLLEAEHVRAWAQIQGEEVATWLAATEDPGARACIEGIIRCMEAQRAAAVRVLSGVACATLTPCTCGLCINDR